MLESLVVPSKLAVILIESIAAATRFRFATYSAGDLGDEPRRPTIDTSPSATSPFRASLVFCREKPRDVASEDWLSNMAPEE